MEPSTLASGVLDLHGRDASLEPFFLVGPTLRVPYANDAALSALRLGRGEVVGRPLLGFCPQWDGSDLLQAIQGCLERRESHPEAPEEHQFLETDVELKSGSWLSVYVHLRCLAEGVAVRFLPVGTGKRIVSVDHLHSHAQHAVALCQIIRRDDRAVDWIYHSVNDRCQILHGDVQGATVSQVFPTLLRVPGLLATLDEVCSTGQSAHFNYFHELFRKWYLVYAYSPEQDYFVTVVRPRLAPRPGFGCLGTEHDSPIRLDETLPFTVAPNQTIFRVGDESCRLYIVRRGWVKLTKTSLDGRDGIVELLFPGDYFDIPSILEGDRVGVTASTLSGYSAELESVDRHWMTTHPELTRSVYKQFMRRLRWQQDMALSLATDKAELRVLRALVRLARGSGCCSQGELRFTMPLTRQELSDYVGTRQETAVRLLSSLRKRGLVTWEGSEYQCNPRIFEDFSLEEQLEA